MTGQTTAGETVVVRKTMPASCEEVFDAWLDSEGMSRWLCPGAVTASEVTLEPRVGGRFRILMNSPQADYEHTGEFRVLDRPSKLQFTWISAGTDHRETLVSIDLRRRGGQCELLLTHHRFPRAESAIKHQQGWSQIADRLGIHLIERRRSGPDDFQLVYEFAAPVGQVYRQFATQAGIANWWTIYCEMEERVGGRATFRFPSSDFYAVAHIARLEPGRSVAWDIVDSKHPANSGFIDLQDWIGTRIVFELEPVSPDRTRLLFTHSGLAPKECFGVCSSAWAFFLNQSLRAYLESGAGLPHTK